MDTPGAIWTQQIYAPSRRKYSATLSADTDIDALIAKLMEFEAKAAAAGLLVDEPGLEAGEQTETIHYVLRTSIVNSRGESPRIYLYTERFNFKFIGIYLNNVDDIEAFESACHVSLDALPFYEGDAALERGKNAQKDAKYLIPLPAPVQIVWKQNPAWEGEDDKQHPKRVFVRWHSVTPAQASNGGSARPTPAPQSTPTGQPIPANPQTTANGNGAHEDQPAQPKNAAPAGQLMADEPTEFVLRSNWVQPHETTGKDGKKTIYYEVEGGATTYSRELFRKVGYTEQDLATWPLDTARRITLLAPLDVYYKPVKSNGREFKQIVRIERVEEAAS